MTSSDRRDVDAPGAAPPAPDQVASNDGPAGQLPPGTPPDGTQPLRRSTSNRMVAGVCGGLGQALGVDPVWFRLAFVVLALGSGAGLVLYLVAWLIMPEGTGTGEVPPATTGHGGPGRGSMIAGLTLVAVGSALLLDTLIPWFDDVVWPLAVMAGGAGLLYVGSRR